MNSGSGPSYMDKLKAKNTPLAIQEELRKEAQEQAIPMVQISAEEWMRLTEAVRRMEALSAELSAQKVVLSNEASKYTEKMMKVAEAQKEATEKALSAQDNERSDRTGWESERESFGSYRQKNSSGRGSVVAPTRTHGYPDVVSTALMGARGVGDLTDLLEDGEESEEEKRQREARNAGTAVGVIAGTITGIAVGLHQNHEPNIENNDDEDENPQIEITM